MTASVQDCLAVEPVKRRRCQSIAAMAMALPANLPISLEIRSLYYRERYPDPVERGQVILERTLEFFADMDNG